MFLTKLITRQLDKENHRLEEDLVAIIDGVTYTAPKTFITDFASIPYPLDKWIKDDNFKYRKSATMHDYFYTIKMNRKKADKLFYDLMESENTPRRYKYSFYIAVRLFGWVRYKKGD